jgi:Zn-dependent peptidase ImmA (M78 family)
MKDTFSKRLKSARLLAGLSLKALSEKMDRLVSHNAIHKYEQGEMLPDSPVLIRLAEVLEVKPDYFFRPFEYEVDRIEFRKKSKLGARQIAAIREQVRDRAERYLEIENFLNIQSAFANPLDACVIRDGEQIEEAVDHLREAWQLGLNALPSVVDMVEDKEVKVIELEAVDGFDGLSGWANGHIPVIVLNQQFTLERKRFTALHELAHLTLTFGEALSEKEREGLCHRFAGAMLIPRATFLRELGEKRSNISIAELIPLREEYGISIQALMRRAFDLKVVSSHVYRRFCVQISSNRTEEGLGRYAGKEHSDRFEQLVYRAAAEEIISLSKAANLFNMKLGAFREKFSAG